MDGWLENSLFPLLVSFSPSAVFFQQSLSFRRHSLSTLSGTMPSSQVEKHWSTGASLSSSFSLAEGPGRYLDRFFWASIGHGWSSSRSRSGATCFRLVKRGRFLNSFSCNDILSPHALSTSYCVAVPCPCLVLVDLTK